MKFAQKFDARVSRVAALAFLLACIPNMAPAQQRREREPNEVYAAGRACIAEQLDAPVILQGFTGREESSQSYIFTQEDNFYYLTGHNEEEAGLVILPAAKPGETHSAWDGPREILFLPAKNPGKEKWNGVRLSPTDPDISARTEFAAVQPFAEMRATVEKLAEFYPEFCTILPYEKENGGYPHEKAVTDWLQLVAPQLKEKDIRGRSEEHTSELQSRQYLVCRLLLVNRTMH